jgi:hypothetical protein
VQALVDCTEKDKDKNKDKVTVLLDKELFNSIQELCVIELKMQVIPLESDAELAQYLEKFVSVEIPLIVNRCQEKRLF